MKKIVVVLLAAILLLMFCACRAEQPEVPLQQTESSKEETAEETQDENIPAPDFTVYDIDGTPVKLSDYKGTPVILNFWASWCGPCKNEMPDFEEAYALYGEQIQFMMVNLTDGSQETVESASQLIADRGYSFPVFYDTQLDAATVYGVRSIPTTYFIDAEGNIAAYGTGSMNLKTVQAGIDMILP